MNIRRGMQSFAAHWTRHQRLGILCTAFIVYMVSSSCHAAPFRFVTTIETPDMAGFGTLFGADLDLSGNQLIVGSPNTTDPGIDESAYIYSFPGGILAHRIPHPQPGRG